jgi:hypothetical protein
MPGASASKSLTGVGFLWREVKRATVGL